jgi:phenylacetate-CoA ligase
VFKPKHVWAYVDSIYELARFAKKNNLYVYSPNSIAVTAGVLTKDAKDCIEEVFRTSVYNQYGSREVGDVAVENIYEEGMQIFEWNNYFEFNEEKKVRVTNLHNYSMPIIRYDIGDTYVPMEGIFKNGIKTSKLKNINGRITGHFRLKNGVIVPAQFFIHFVGVVFNDGGIQKFQIIQNTYEHITIKYVSSKENLYNLKENVEKSIRKVMGRKLIVTWQKVKDIPRSKSGKYLYTISKVSNEN